MSKGKERRWRKGGNLEMTTCLKGNLGGGPETEANHLSALMDTHVPEKGGRGRGAVVKCLLRSVENGPVPELRVHAGVGAGCSLVVGGRGAL